MSKWARVKLGEVLTALEYVRGASPASSSLRE
jgi:hypothetical protein